jgi:hypothetical protein
MALYVATVVLTGAPGNYETKVVQDTDPNATFVQHTWMLNVGDLISLGLNWDLAEDTEKVLFSNLDVVSPRDPGHLPPNHRKWASSPEPMVVQNQGRPIFIIASNPSAFMVIDVENSPGRGNDAFKLKGRVMAFKKGDPVNYELVDFDPLVVNQSGGGG